MNARLKLVAAERGVADADMKWIGRLRHHDLVFVQKHKLCWAWVLRGDDLQGRPRLVAALLPSGRPRMARWSHASSEGVGIDETTRSVIGSGWRAIVGGWGGKQQGRWA
jgi:hypothetical protein